MFSLCVCMLWGGEMCVCECVHMHAHSFPGGWGSVLGPAQLRHRHPGLTGAASSQAKSFSGRSQRAERW